MKITEINQVQENLLLQVSPFPYNEQFIAWGLKTLQDYNLTPSPDHSEGADRHMLVFTFNSARFSLNYESYSQSIWIAPEEAASQEHLDALKGVISALIK